MKRGIKVNLKGTYYNFYFTEPDYKIIKKQAKEEKIFCLVTHDSTAHLLSAMSK